MGRRRPAAGLRGRGGPTPGAVVVPLSPASGTTSSSPSGRRPEVRRGGSVEATERRRRSCAPATSWTSRGPSGVAIRAPRPASGTRTWLASAARVVVTIGQGRPRHAPWLTSRVVVQPDQCPEPVVVHGQDFAVAGSRTRVRQATSPHAWTASRRPAASHVNVGRERPPEAVVDGQRRQDLPGRTAAIQRPAPHAEVGSAGAIHARLVDRRGRRVDRRSPDDRPFRRQGPGAAVARIECVQPRRRPVVRADENDPPERAGRERLAGERPAGMPPRRPPMPDTRRWPRSAPSPSSTGSRRYQGSAPLPRRASRGRPGRGRRDRARRSGTGARDPRPIARAERRRCDEPDRGDGDETRADRTQPT